MPWKRGWCGALPTVEVRRSTGAAWAVEPFAAVRVADGNILNSASSGPLQLKCSLKSCPSAAAVVFAYGGLLGYNSVLWKVGPDVRSLLSGRVGYDTGCGGVGWMYCLHIRGGSHLTCASGLWHRVVWKVATSCFHLPGRGVPRWKSDRL
jgi:hypothetical protein